MNIQPTGSAALAALGQLPKGVAATGTAATASSITPELPDTQQPSAAQLTQAVASINQTLQKLAPGLEFSIDQESKRTIVKVVDQQTKELIRQMPSAETLEIAKAMDRVQGLLISLRA